MPVFARAFNVSAAQSSLSLSLTTALLAPAMIVAGAVSETRGRKSIMVASLFISAAVMFLSAFARRWETFVGARALVGITFAGLPAVSMAYLSEEVHPQSIGLAMGLTIGGNGLGGMFGRLLASSLADALSWRYSIAAIGTLGLIAAFIFWNILPPSRHFTPRPLRVGALLRSFWDQLRDPRLVPLYAEGFLLMGSFVTAYNYITYHLLAPPYSLSQTVVGSIFVVYPVGIFASAWIGSLAGRAGRGRMLMLMLGLMLVGVALTTLTPLVCIVVGIATVTFGFFAGHSVASAWVGLRATHAKAQAAALYLFFYYMGSSVAGSAGGVFWARGSWNGVVAFVSTMLVAALLIALPLQRGPATAPATTRG